MKSTAVRTSVLGSAALGLLVMMCSTPTDREPVHWRTDIDVPVTNESFILGSEFGNLFQFTETIKDSVDTIIQNPDGTEDTVWHKHKRTKMRILNVDSTYGDDGTSIVADTTDGDTVVFSIIDTGYTEMVVDEDSLEDKTFEESVGPIPLSGVPDVDVGPVPLGTAANVPVPGGIDSIVFHGESDPLQVTVENPTSADLSNVVVSIGGKSGTLGALGAGESKTVDIDAAGMKIESSTPMQITGDVAGGSMGTGGLNVSFSLNGLTARKVTVADSLVQFSRTYTNRYEISDSIDIDYIDLEYGFFLYSMRNGTDVDMNVTATHRHLWVTPHCRSKGVTDVDSLYKIDTRNDSLLAYYGEITQGPVVAKAGGTQEFDRLNLSGNRLFTEWEVLGPDSGRTITEVNYLVSTPEPTGKHVTISSSDSLVFTIAASFIQFKEMFGRLAENYERESDTEYVRIDYPWNESAIKSLRGKLYLQKVLANIAIEVELPDDRAYLDSMRIHFEAALDSPQIVQTGDTTYTNIRNDSILRYSIPITNLVNAYPDSVAVSVQITVPDSTEALIVNDLRIVEEGTGVLNDKMGSMTVKAFVDYNLDAFFDMEVRDTAILPLGTSEFKVAKWMDMIGKMEDREAGFNMYVTNFTNLHLRLMGMITPGIPADTLEAWDSLGVLPFDTVAAILAKEGEAESRGYVNFLGTRGIYVPPRNATRTDSSFVTLNDSQMDAIFSDSINGILWQVRFLPYETVHADALADTDWVKINSWIHVEGTQNTDSVFSLFE